MMALEFQMRITFDDGTEECNCFATFEEAETAYNDRLASETFPGEMELIQVYAQNRVEGALVCGDCKLEVEEIVRTNSKGMQQCSDCYLVEEGPQT
ncbi:MAG: hypothetical protein HY348_06430 [Nitrospira defluvii]|nr:hypothetical protein [Nitrospira defluvii]